MKVERLQHLISGGDGVEIAGREIDADLQLVQLAVGRQHDAAALRTGRAASFDLDGEREEGAGERRKGVEQGDGLLQ